MSDPTRPSPRALAADLSPAMRLLAACCVHPQDSESTRRIARLVGEVHDWREFAQLAVRHQVQGFVQDRLAACEVVPAEWRANWANAARTAAAHNLRQARATGELHSLLLGAGIENLVLKGLPLAARVYGSLTIKRSADIDLLVRPGDASAAVGTLEQRGFRAFATGVPLSKAQLLAVMRHHKEITLRDAEGLVVDLHWRLVDNRCLLDGIEPLANAQRVHIDNLGDIAVLGEADEFAYLCAHGALSDWSRLKWLADVNAVIGDKSGDELLALQVSAARLGASNCVLQALGLRAMFWDRPLPDTLERELSAIRSPEFLTFPLKRMAAPYRPASLRDTARRIVNQTRARTVLFGSRWRAMRELGAHFYALPDLVRLPLPRALDWLYVPLRPLFWISRKLR